MKTFILLILALLSFTAAQEYATTVITSSATCELSETQTAIAAVADGRCYPTATGGSATITCSATQVTTTEYSDTDCSANPQVSSVDRDTCTQNSIIFCGDLPSGLPQGQFGNVFEGNGCSGELLVSVFTPGACNAQGCASQNGLSASVTCGNSFPSSASALIAFPLLVIAALFLSF